MLKYAPFEKDTLYTNNVPSKVMILTNWYGKIGEVDHTTMIQDGIFIREPGEVTYWLKNEEFDLPIMFTGDTRWANSDTVYRVTVPKLDVHATITGYRLSTIIGNATINNGMLIGTKWRFGRRGYKTFIEFV